METDSREINERHNISDMNSPKIKGMFGWRDEQGERLRGLIIWMYFLKCIQRNKSFLKI